MIPLTICVLWSELLLNVGALEGGVCLALFLDDEVELETVESLRSTGAKLTLERRVERSSDPIY